MPPSHEPDRDDGGFLSRWSRRKVQVRQGLELAEPPVAPPVVVAAPRLPVVPAPQADPASPAAGRAHTAPAVTEQAEAVPPPTLADVAALTAESDFSRFVASGVEPGVKNAALKKLFTDPHFNIMDGLDTYIDDYGKPDPLPLGMLRQMAQSHALGLFADDPPAPPGADPRQARAPAADTPVDPAEDAVPAPSAALPHTLPPPKTPPDEDAALRLQPHDAAGPAGPDPGAEPHAGRLG
jgi:Protein of unknown function (DUF3306)